MMRRRIRSENSKERKRQRKMRQRRKWERPTKIAVVPNRVRSVHAVHAEPATLSRPVQPATLSRPVRWYDARTSLILALAAAMLALVLYGV